MNNKFFRLSAVVRDVNACEMGRWYNVIVFEM